MMGISEWWWTVAVLCVSIAVVSAVPEPAGGQRRCQDYRLYFDHGTEQCELCGEICRNADRQGTQEQCQYNCPYYLVSMSCDQAGGWFYDELHNSCRPCRDICHSPPHPQPLCVSKCADWLTALPRADQAPCEVHSQAAARESGAPPTSAFPCGLHTGGTPPPSLRHTHVPVWIVVLVIVIAATVAVVLATVGVITMPHSPLAYRRVGQSTNEGAHRGGVGSTPRGTAGRVRGEGCPVEESGAALHQSTAMVAADGTLRSMTIPVKTAFADLSVRHHTTPSHPV